MRLRRLNVLVLVGGAVALAAVVLVTTFAGSDGPRQDRCNDTVALDATNVTRQLRTVEDGYELELWSRESFIARALPTILRVGTVETSFSRSGAAGSSNTIIFLIGSNDYAAMETGDGVIVHHGLIPEGLEANPELAGSVLYAAEGSLWTFGLFDKSQLDCPPLDPPPLPEG